MFQKVVKLSLERRKQGTGKRSTESSQFGWEGTSTQKFFGYSFQKPTLACKCGWLNRARGIKSAARHKEGNSSTVPCSGRCGTGNTTYPVGSVDAKKTRQTKSMYTALGIYGGRTSQMRQSDWDVRPSKRRIWRC